MKIIYNIIATIGAVLIAYMMGVHVGNIKCDAHMANDVSEHIILNTQIMEQTNDAAIRTSIGNIRSILREKYTISE